ncbi:MAG: magnesium transporter [Candidatus Nezhaarchaeales archaeon]|nr:MAG: divalent cation transporter [Candidatus Nezhaarchaeota archaeon WYZ-LMO8]TDA37378.1 MAG: divalent cation transporter [Candidatus Nezhaarchaeota archaeon WYZ-LMO7]
MFKNTIRQGLLTQFVSLTIDVLAGIGLALMRGALEELPGMLIMVPAFLQMRGAIGGTLASRLSSALHVGIIEPRLKLSKELLQNIIGTLILSLVLSVLIGCLAHFMCLLFGFTSAGFLTLLLLSLIAGALSSLVITLVTVIMTIKVYQRGLDPDVIMGPIITTLGDVVSIPCLFLAALVLMAMGL